MKTGKMTKEQTIYEIKKLFQKYNKMRNDCNAEWERLEESCSRNSRNSEYVNEEQSMIVAEEQAYSRIIEDLEDLINEIGE